MTLLLLKQPFFEMKKVKKKTFQSSLRPGNILLKGGLIKTDAYDIANCFWDYVMGTSHVG